MGCPQCQSEEIDASGACLVCGYQIPDLPPAPEPDPQDNEKRSLPGMIEMDYSGGASEPSPKEELPQWRKDLAQRLQAIKQKRDAAGSAAAQSEDKVAPFPSTHTPIPAPQIARQDRILEKAPERKPPPKPRTPAPRQKILQPVETEPSAPKAALKQADTQEIRNLIDSAVSKQSATISDPIHGMEAPIFAPLPPADQEGKLILLSRTLSGLVDLICVVLCTGAFIIAADHFSGIIVLDSVSLVDFAVLFLLTYFVYSIFFLAASSQTIGMMITDLRLVGVEERRPSLRQLLGRCCGYLVSLFGLGIGLLWGLFNRENRCFHDRISGTYVVRI